MRHFLLLTLATCLWQWLAKTQGMSTRVGKLFQSFLLYIRVWKCLTDCKEFPKSKRCLEENWQITSTWALKAELWTVAEPVLFGSLLTCNETWGLPNVYVALVPQSDLTRKNVGQAEIAVLIDPSFDFITYWPCRQLQREGTLENCSSHF